MTGGAEIEVFEQYDNEDDVYYVTVQTGEPSIVEEYDDNILVEFGIFTQMPTGFRILNYTKHQNEAAVFKGVFVKFCQKLGLHKLEESKTWKRELDKALEEVVA